jgi:hypothetical protein
VRSDEKGLAKPPLPGDDRIFPASSCVGVLSCTGFKAVIWKHLSPAVASRVPGVRNPVEPHDPGFCPAESIRQKLPSMPILSRDESAGRSDNYVQSRTEDHHITTAPTIARAAMARYVTA